MFLEIYITPFMVFIYNPLCIFVHLYSYIVVIRTVTAIRPKIVCSYLSIIGEL